jgi:ElaB/YqjD/DUF883 family membrane-anchored ribosome-binding protein
MTTETNQRSTNGSTSSSPARLQEAAGGIVDSAGQAAQSQASVAMNRAGETLEQVAQAIRDTGNQMRQDRPEIAGFAETGAQRVDQLSMYLRQHDARDIIDDAERFARRQPALVLGGGLALGLLVGRLLRSGAEPMGSGQGGSAQAWQSGSGNGSRTGWMGGGTTGMSSTAGTGYGSSYGTDYAADYGSTGSGSVRSANSTARSSGTPDTGLGGAGTADELGYTDAMADDTTSGSSVTSSTGSSRSRGTSAGTSTSGTTARRKSTSSGG